MILKAINSNKKQYLDLLLLADEQESMIDKYLEQGDMYILSQDDYPVAVAVVVAIDSGTCELKSLAVDPKFQRKGYGKKVIAMLEDSYKTRFKRMIVGTGDSPLALPFYESCGFRVYGRVENFFVDNYDHPIFEAGEQLVDMIYLEKLLQ